MRVKPPFDATAYLLGDRQTRSALDVPQAMEHIVVNHEGETRLTLYVPGNPALHGNNALSK